VSYTCRVCGVELIGGYNWAPSYERGKNYTCRKCAVEIEREYRKANPDKVREGRRRHYIANKERINERINRWYLSNADSIKERLKKRYDGNPDIFRERSRKDFRCIKTLCPRIEGFSNVVRLTCPVCGVAFGLRQSRIDYQYKVKGQTVFYCSKACSGISRRKSWDEKSPYAQNIKRIKQEVGA